MKKKTYLILSAMKEELDGLCVHLPLVSKNEGKFSYSFFENDSIRVYAMQSGIGKVAMAMTMSSFLATHEVDEVINVGVAGSISSKLKKMQIFVGERCCYHDVDVTEFGYSIGQMCSIPLYYECDSELVKKALVIDSKRIVSGLIISGDSFVSKNKINQSWFKNFDNPIACDMESAAVGQVCHTLNIPFLIIRSISDDTSEEGNKAIYDGNLEEACKIAGEVVAKLIQ